MGLKPYYLGDTSALARLGTPEISARLAPLIEGGLVARCTPTDLEAGFSSSSPIAHAAMRRERAAWPSVTLDQRVLDRAVEVQDALAAESRQRGAKIADLGVAQVTTVNPVSQTSFEYSAIVVAIIITLGRLHCVGFRPRLPTPRVTTRRT